MTTIKDPEVEALEQQATVATGSHWRVGVPRSLFDEAIALLRSRSQTAEPVAFAYYWNPPECGGEEHSSLSWTRIADRDGKREVPLYAATPPEDAGK